MPITFLEYRQLQELFEQSFVWRWEKDPRRDKTATATFATEKHKYIVDIMVEGPLGTEATVLFAVEDAPLAYNSVKDTNEYLASKVLATVIDIIKDYIEIRNPEIISFVALKAGIGRARVYKKLLQRVVPDNYEVYVEDDGDEIMFTIYLKD